MSVEAIIVAAGRGVRMESSRPKAFLSLAGRTLLERSLAAFLTHPRVSLVVAAVPDPDEAARMLGPSAGNAVLVCGGATRQESVSRGLAALPAGAGEIILVHDAARPLVTRDVIDAVIDATVKSGAAVPGIVPTDTIKRVSGDGAVEGTLPRDSLRLAQTPQGFRGATLRDAYARAEREGFTGTDDAALVERAGGRVTIVEGSTRNIKITTPLDLILAEAILARETTGGGRG
jgi:2-C-methyl-D-erythritol 4-phosphate cytidylyltransferase